MNDSKNVGNPITPPFYELPFLSPVWLWRFIIAGMAAKVAAAALAKKSIPMSKAEIIEEWPKLSSADRAPAFGLRVLQRRFCSAPPLLRRPKSAGKPDALQTLRDFLSGFLRVIRFPQNSAPAFGLRALQRRFRFAPPLLRRPKSAGKPDALETLRDFLSGFLSVPQPMVPPYF